MLLPGTAPALAYDPGGHLMVVAVGMDHHAYLEPEGTDSGFNDLGGQTTSNPAVTVVDGTAGHPNTRYAVVFVRGTDTALWARQVTLPLTMPRAPISSGGWQPLGGRLTSGIAAQTATAGPYTCVFALGTDNQFWMRIGAWPSSLGPWQRA